MAVNNMNAKNTINYSAHLTYDDSKMWEADMSTPITLPFGVNDAEISKTSNVMRYMAPTFNLARWFNEFWSDESGSAAKHINTDMLTRLFYLDSCASKGKPHPLAFDEKDQSVPFAIRLVKSRAQSLHFDITPGMCYYIAALGATPAQLVMFTTAVALAWADTQCRQIMHGPSTAMGTRDVDLGRIETFDTPCLDWLCHGNILDVSEGNWIHEIPGPQHLRKMWDLQKISDSELRHQFAGRDNFLDVIRVITPEMLAESLNGATP